MATGVMAELNHEGDTKVTWDADNKDEVANARATFDKLKAKGFTAFRAGKTLKDLVNRKRP